MGKPCIICRTQGGCDGCDAALLRELAHAKVVFQLRAIEAVIRDGPAVEWLEQAGPIAARLNEQSQQDNREPAQPNKRAGRNSR